MADGGASAINVEPALAAAMFEDSSAADALARLVKGVERRADDPAGDVVVGEGPELAVVEVVQLDVRQIAGPAAVVLGLPDLVPRALQVLVGAAHLEQPLEKRSTVGWPERGRPDSQQRQHVRVANTRLALVAPALDRVEPVAWPVELDGDLGEAVVVGHNEVEVSSQCV